ncbi:MAG: hypothetical protein Q9195_007537 [Heterodermia aff. obscurata]
MDSPIACKRPMIKTNSFLGDQAAVGDDRQASILMMHPLLLSSYDADLATGGRKTKRRWAWFSAARGRDDKFGTRLGTLNYLPLEIRRMIYEHIFQDYHRDRGSNMDVNTWQYYGRYHSIEDGRSQKHLKTHDHPSFFEHSFYWPPYPKKQTIFRLTSPTIKEEYEYWFLHARQFHFECPFAYREFMDQLTAEQQGLIASMQIEIMSENVSPFISDNEVDQAWMSICDELPTKLRRVSLRLDWFCRLELPEHVNGVFVRGRKEIKNVARAAELLSALRKRILRRIPGVKILFGGWAYDKMIQEDKATILRAWEEYVDL